MDRDESHAVIGTAEVEDGEIGDDPTQIVTGGDEAAQFPSPVVTDATHHVDLRNEHRRHVLRDKETRRIVDGVAWPTAHTEQLGLGLLPWTDVGDVGVAEAVDLAGAHHHVATAAPQRVEHLSEGDPTFDHFVGGADRQIAGHEERFTVGDHEIGFERGPGESGAEHRDGAHTGGEDLAIASPGFGAGDGDHVGEGRCRDVLAHDRASFAAAASALQAVTADW